MSEILNFSCPINSCGRKFATKEKLDEHIKLRHPSTKNKNDNKTNKKTKVNNNNKKDDEELDSENIKEEIKKMEEKTENKNRIINNKNEDNKIKMKNTEEKKEKLEKEKNKIILDDLYSKINSLENYFENENLELQKQFELAEIPNIDDNILLENEKLEQEENEDNNDNDINNNIEENKILNDKTENKTQEIKEDKKENIINIDNENLDNKNNLDLNKNQKNYDKDKIITITEELILSNSNLDSKNDDNDDFEQITSLNLSKKNIASFMNNRNVNFTEIPNLKILNISYNWMTYTYDLSLFLNLEELYINDNKIDDISFSEFLPHLKILNCENNEITYITSLKKCNNLKILKLSQNKIQYLNSSLGVFKSLNLLEELTIKDNPFLSNIFAYKQYFLYEFQNLLKFDNEDINDIDRDIAGRFVRKNNTMYKNTPLFNMNQNDEDFKNEENDGKLKDTFRVGNTIITKEMVVPYKGKVKYSNLNERNKLENKDKLKNKEENDKNKELKDIIKNQKKEIDDIKLELENINQLNKEYEIIIEDYKIKLEQKKSKSNNINKSTNNKEEKKIKLLKELDMWKKEYIDLFNKINQSSLFPSLLSNDKVQNPKTHLLKTEEEEKEEEKEKEEEINTDLNKANPNDENKNEIKRPQTAQVKRTNPRRFDGLCEGLKIMYSKNQFLDVLEEESDEEEEKEKNDNNEIKDEIDYDGNDIIPDDEIDELFMKSCADLQKMKDEIKFMNESIDKNGNNLLNNTININNKGGKMKLNPVIVKKENNPNFLGNKTIFGNINQKKV